MWEVGLFWSLSGVKNVFLGDLTLGVIVLDASEGCRSSLSK